MKTATALCALLAIVVITALSFVQAAADPAAIGQTAPQFSLPDQNGKTVNLSDYAGKIIVLEWVNPQCPFVKRHYQAKTMINLANQYSPQGVVWLAINSRQDASNSENKSWVDQNNLSYPILNDSAGQAGRAYHARSTPDMFIIDKDGKLAYSGAIDNDPDGDKTTDRINYVKQALDELLAGKPVSVPQTKSYGCGVHLAK